MVDRDLFRCRYPDHEAPPEFCWSDKESIQNVLQLYHRISHNQLVEHKYGNTQTIDGFVFKMSQYGLKRDKSLQAHQLGHNLPDLPTLELESNH